ncbi:hypothetical protein SG34_003310 [Thalassomonas viridans]|uniref:Uncharacterized protein n=1 Tax=Thalassomonas viridans TaxID=137584 RepID=A0AAE9Z6H1_9GAMM|nr:hypothetical protein [Thalassomonas viridans]WDE05972.1 hypothetical protein SG34_003310 [Thalassomonas viridans]
MKKTKAIILAMGLGLGMSGSLFAESDPNNWTSCTKLLKYCEMGSSAHCDAYYNKCM